MSGQQKDHFYIDSGASHNFTPFVADFRGALETPKVRSVRVGDGKSLRVLGMGMVTVLAENGERLTLTKVHLVPQLHSGLISVPHLTSKGFEVFFKGPVCTVSKGSTDWIKGHKSQGQQHSLHQAKL